MIKNDIGINAGAIWRLLNEKGALSIEEIAEYTNFRLMYIHNALGWLAREDKIRFFEKSETMYVELTAHYQEMYF
jgi:predicted transcriptional regulator